MIDLRAVEALQRSGVFRPAAEPSLRWGVVGTGWIADQFVQAVQQHTRQRVVAVGSRTVDRAATFAGTHGIDIAHGSYSALIDDPHVDVVYIGMTAESHRALALQSIAAAKSVLVEKPMALTAAEAAEIRIAARSAGVFVMEAMWTRYLPQSDAIRVLVADGALGDIELVEADHGQALAGDPSSRLLRPELGGGALLDLGVYPIAFASELLGTPDAVLTAGDLLPSGVDGSVAMVLSYTGSTAIAMLSTTIRARTPITAMIAGTAGRITVAAPFHVPTGFSLTGPGFFDEAAHWRDLSGVTAMGGLSYQATALARYVAEGRTESPLYGLDESVAVLTVIETARAALRPASS